MITAPETLPLHRTLQVLRDGMAAGLHLGGQLYVSRDFRTVGDIAFGERRPGDPMTSDTLMIWLSSGKPVTAIAIGQLWERGLLELDDPVVEHLPEFAAHGKDRISLRHLLTHTAGFRILKTGWPEASWQEIIDTLCNARPEPRWLPGQKAGYHLSSSWFILGEVIRRLDGRDYSQYVRDEIFLPLGMEDSWVGMPSEQHRAYGQRLGTMFNTEGEAPLPRAWTAAKHVVGCSPGGNAHGPIRELGRLYEMLLARGSWQGRRILRPQTVEALTARHRVGLLDRTFKHHLDWGLGFILNSAHYGEATAPYGYGAHASSRAFGHSGFQSSTGFADPEHRLVVSLVVNGHPGATRHLERFHLLTSSIYQDLGLGSP